MMVAGEHLLESLFLDDVERLAQAVQRRQGRRVGEVASGVRLDLVVEIEISVPAVAVLDGGDGLPARTNDAEACRKHQALLRAGDGEIHAPVVEAEVDAPDRGDAVDI